MKGCPWADPGGESAQYAAPSRNVFDWRPIAITVALAVLLGRK